MDKTIIDKLAYVFVKDRRALVSKSRGKDVWYIPGGKREEGETDEQALTREIKEELSVDIIQETIEKYGVFEAQAHGKPEGTIVRMSCYTAEFKGVIKASSEIEEVSFLSYAEKESTSTVDQIIFDNLNAKGLID